MPRTSGVSSEDGSEKWLLTDCSETALGAARAGKRTTPSVLGRRSPVRWSFSDFLPRSSVTKSIR